MRDRRTPGPSTCRRATRAPTRPRPRDTCSVAADLFDGVEVERAGEGRQAVGTAAARPGRAAGTTSRRGPSASGDARRTPGSSRPAGRSGRRAVRRSRSARAIGSERRPARWPGERRRGAGTARATARAVVSSATKSGLAAVARCDEQRDRRGRGELGSAPSSATGSAGTLYTVSAGSASGSRLVARIRTAGQTRSSRSTKPAIVSRTCSQLSSTSSSGPAPSRSSTDSVTDGPAASAHRAGSRSPRPRRRRRGSGPARRPRPEAGRRATSSAAARSASCVLPIPPGPSNVTSRWRSHSSTTSARSSSRPMRCTVDRPDRPRLGSPSLGGARDDGATAPRVGRHVALEADELRRRVEPQVVAKAGPVLAGLRSASPWRPAR